jgi:hypothetical protein
VRCGILLYSNIDCVLKLSGWNLCCDVFDFKLLKLSGGNISILVWLNGVLGLYCWLVLRFRRIASGDGNLRRGLLLVVFSDGVFKLSRRNIHCIDIEHKLRKLLRGYLSGFHWLDLLFGLRLRLLLRNDGSFGCNRDMCDREVFSFLGDLMYKLWSGV